MTMFIPGEKALNQIENKTKAFISKMIFQDGPKDQSHTPANDDRAT